MTLLVIRNLQMCMTIGRRSSPIGALEELDVVRGVGEAAFVTDFGDRHIGRNQQKARMNQALVHKPLVGRCVEVATELLFEGGERAIGLLGEALDRDRLEEVVIDHLLKTFARSIDRCEYPTTQTLVALCHDEVDKLGHLDILGRLVVRIAVLAQVAVRVEEEVEYTRSYLTIQKMRYKDKLEYDIQVSPEVLGQKIPKLVLQPLVENAIYHGVKYKEGKGVVRIEGQLEQKELILRISDDGIGMTEEQLAKIFEKRETDIRKNGVGVLNVHERIQLYYGKDYGLKIK